MSGHSKPEFPRVIREDILDGADQLGVLFVFDGGAYWYGSTLDIHETRRLAPFNNATSMQVVAGILGALDWMKKYPNKGIVEAESMDYEHVLAVARPYLGNVSGVMTDWQPGGHGSLQFTDFILVNQDKSHLLAA